MLLCYSRRQMRLSFTVDFVLWLAEMLHPADEIAADRALHQVRSIVAYRNSPSPPPGHPLYDLIHHMGYIRHVRARQKAIQGGVVGNGFQRQGGTQLRVLSESHLRLAESPVFMPHQAEHGQQLRLGKLTIAEFGSLRGQHRLSDIERQSSKSHQSDFGHTNFAKTPEQLQFNALSAASRSDVSRMSTEPACFKNIFVA